MCLIASTMRPALVLISIVCRPGPLTLSFVLVLILGRFRRVMGRPRTKPALPEFGQGTSRATGKPSRIRCLVPWRQMCMERMRSLTRTRPRAGRTCGPATTKIRSIRSFLCVPLVMGSLRRTIASTPVAALSIVTDSEEGPGNEFQPGRVVRLLDSLHVVHILSHAVRQHGESREGINEPAASHVNVAAHISATSL